MAQSKLNRRQKRLRRHPKNRAAKVQRRRQGALEALEAKAKRSPITIEQINAAFLQAYQAIERDFLAECVLFGSGKIKVTGGNVRCPIGY